jgi:hypothetical protein
MSKFPGSVANALFEDVVSQHYTNRAAISEVFGERKRGCDSAFAFLVSIIQVSQAEFGAISQELKKVTSAIAACNYQDLLDTSLDQSLDWVVDHWPVINRQ